MGLDLHENLRQVLMVVRCMTVWIAVVATHAATLVAKHITHWY